MNGICAHAVGGRSVQRAQNPIYEERSFLPSSPCELGLSGSLRVEWSPGLQFAEEPFELLPKGVQTKPIAWARMDGWMDGRFVRSFFCWMDGRFVRPFVRWMDVL